MTIFYAYSKVIGTFLVVLSAFDATNRPPAWHIGLVRFNFVRARGHPSVKLPSLRPLSDQLHNTPFSPH